MSMTPEQLADKEFVAHKNDRAKNTQQIVGKLDELKPSETQKTAQEAMSAFVQMLKGDPGKTPVKGEDYLTESEIEQIKKDITPVRGIDYEDGKPGNDGYSPVKGVDYNDGKDGVTPDKQEIINKILSSIEVPKSIPGKPGKPGRDGSPDTGLEIAKKLTELKGEDRLDVESLKGLDKVESNFLQQAKGFVSKTLAGQVDVNIPNPTNGQVLTYNKATNKWVASSAGSGSGIVQTIVAGTGISVNSTDPANPIVSTTSTLAGTFNYEAPATGTINGSNNIFTFTHTPGAILLNGATQIPGGIDITVSGSTVTFVTPPETGSTLYNQYLT